MLIVRLLACASLLGISAAGVIFAFKNAGRDLWASAIAVAAASLILVYLVIHKPAGVTRPDIVPGTLEETDEPSE